MFSSNRTLKPVFNFYQMNHSVPSQFKQIKCFSCGISGPISQIMKTAQAQISYWEGSTNFKIL